MIPTNDGRDDINSWPGGHYRHSRLQPPKLERDPYIDRAFIAGLRAGWKQGLEAGYLDGKYAYAILSDKQRAEIEEELKEIHNNFESCIENRLKDINGQEDARWEES